MMHKKNSDGNCKNFLRVEITADVSLSEISEMNHRVVRIFDNNISRYLRRKSDLFV